MNIKFNKIRNYIISEKKQILFALFAFIIFLLSKSDNNYLLFNAVPAAVAAGAKVAAKKGAEIAAKKGAQNIVKNEMLSKAGEAAKKGAIDGAKRGAVNGALNKDENDSTLGSALRGAKNGAVSGAKSGAIGSLKAPGNGNKNTNPNPNKRTSNLNSDRKSDNSPKPINNEHNNEKNDKSNNLSNLDDSSNNDGKTTKKVAKVITAPLIGGGCIIGFLFLLIFSVPIILTSITNPISSIISGFKCTDESDSKICEIGEKVSAFIEKTKNLLVYFNFSENDQVVTDKLNDIYVEILKEKNTSIDIPLLLSTILYDVENINNNEEGYEKLLQRTYFLKDLAELQISNTSVAYICKSKIVNGTEVFYKETDYSVTDLSKINAGECNSLTVNTTLKEEVNGLDTEGYYDRLKENKNILKSIYPDIDLNNEDIFNELIETIKLRRDVFAALYDEDSEENNGIGNIPMTLFYDPLVNLASPLNGDVGITSPYGYRSGAFAGMHKGIDLVSNDKTIYAAGDGIVTRSNTEIEGGNIIEITHTDSNGEKYITMYAHLSKFLVTKGNVVKSGDAIGIMGCTGTLCSGVHLHFQIWNYSTKETYNPANLIAKSN